jgi:hypothetical protein
MNMYREMHPDEAESLSQRDDLGQESFDRKEAPSESFLLLLQTTIQGFGFQDKKWSEFFVAHTFDGLFLRKYRDSYN